MRYFYVLLISALIAGCKTNPPTSPESFSYDAGKIYLTVNIEFDADQEEVSKKALLEDFANVSCIPCVTSDKIVETLAENTYGPEKLIPIKFATNFPSPNDPFYLANEPACDYRMEYYNIFVAPTIIIDGTSRPTSTDSIDIKSKIDASLQSNPPASIIITDENVDSAYVINMTIKIYSINDFSNLVLQTAITEKEINLDSAPGSNGLTDFYYVMREMLPDFNGIDLENMEHTGTITLNEESEIKSTWNLDKINTVAFIQNISTKEVLQAGSTY